MPLCELHYYSDALKKQTACHVILPRRELPGPWSVMFLLHGLSDDYTIWQRRTSIERYVEGLPLIVVMPDGGRSFYLDAIEGPSYGTALGEELPDVVSTYFPTKRPWCVTGLSMGGYGAIKLALDRPELFRSAASHSGAVHFGHWNESRDEEFLREFRRVVGPNPAGSDCDLYAKVLTIDRSDLPALRLDCGSEDFLVEPNRDFHRHLVEHGISHEYQEFPGEHEWGYWDRQVEAAIAFHGRNLGF
jgi:putative tributyrin esterase